MIGSRGLSGTTSRCLLHEAAFHSESTRSRRHGTLRRGQIGEKSSELKRIQMVRSAANELSVLSNFVHALLRPHLAGVIEFASNWSPELRQNPRRAYDATQLPMEEAAHLSAAASTPIFNRAACIGGMAVFYEAFRQARSSL